MNNKQVFVYGVLELINDLKGIYVEHIYFKKLIKLRKFTEIFHCWMTKVRNRKEGLFVADLNRFCEELVNDLADMINQTSAVIPEN